MATIQATVLSERWLNEVMIGGVSAVIDGDWSDHLLLPPGLGDVAVMELFVDASPLATPVANLELKGLRALIISSDGTAAVDMLAGNAQNRWSLRGADAAINYVSPDPLVLWRQNERLGLASPELDSNAIPTVQYAVRVKVVRVPPVEGAVQPLRLVR